MPVKNRLAEMHDQITEWRRDLHAHPELMYDLPRTSAFVAEKLRAFGCDEVVEGIGRSGVVGVIRGRSNSTGRAVGLRADMDALPIKEATGLPYTSKTPGRMHAGGHDGHTAMLLGAAQYLAETRNFDGSAVVIFQPAEEGGAGGKAMVDDGLMDRFGIDEVYGMHNMPGIPLGSFAIRPGPMMAATDDFDITLTGIGGHAAKPHKCIDPVLAASHVVIALQSIAARSVDPLKQVVVSVCSFRTESDATNVIPQTVRLRGTVRTMEEDVRDLAETRLKALVENTAAAFGATAAIDYQRGYPVTENDPDCAAFAAEVARAVAGGVEDTAPLMGGEDFSYMLNARPGAYIFLGNGDTAAVHHPAYNFDDAAIPYGCSWFAELVERRLPAA
ncbi:M20 aminoacylase family protein [Rhodovulum adriaticum]|uniref:Hippurate hydrolase n=1 Tax=Rhodovulum adriaticum TaxID=35804 RepID=A0A4V6NQK7_RHOAD|nr:M20 aminoacylase family protein [Rhodovulum adriaticum]MBK1636265.1 amidohydrolase [Rhodovulum adriaticum]TCP26266.1 hippurate hydrolase [Rhodovulum adriaticum]